MERYAIMLNASTEDIGPAANGLEYALDLDDAGYESVVYFDGIATRWVNAALWMNEPVPNFMMESGMGHAVYGVLLGLVYGVIDQRTHE